MMPRAERTDEDRRAGADRLAVVTGASRGLGLTLAGFLAHAGYRVVATARHAEELGCATDALGAGKRLRPLPGSVCDPAHRREVARAAGDRLDLLVHNASALGPSPLPRLADADPDALRAVLETNVLAPLALTQALLPALRRAGGMVVVVTSDAAHGAYLGWGLYGASKAALELLAATLAAEEDGVATVLVDPGDMHTDMHQRAFPGEDIGDRPTPEVTLPFWAWLLGRRHEDVTGQRFRAQAEAWTVDGEAGR